jgi:hypothetical protein
MRQAVHIAQIIYWLAVVVVVALIGVAAVALADF